MLGNSDELPPLLDNDWLNQLRERVAVSERLLVCLDFDGTLAPIVDDPDDATLRSGNEELLRRLADDPDVIVAIVSGRSLDDLRERVDVDGIHYAGNHGLEWDDGDGRSVRAEAHEAKRALKDVVETLRTQLSDIRGCTIEDKGLTATVHYRRVSEDMVPEVIETTKSAVETVDELQWRSGKEIIEIRPAVPGGKDRIVENLRDQYPSAVTIYVGDDVTDEDVFEAMGEDGFGIVVGDRSDTAASVRVPDPAGVTMLLSWLVQGRHDTER